MTEDLPLHTNDSKSQQRGRQLDSPSKIVKLKMPASMMSDAPAHSTRGATSGARAQKDMAREKALVAERSKHDMNSLVESARKEREKTMGLYDKRLRKRANAEKKKVAQRAASVARNVTFSEDVEVNSEDSEEKEEDAKDVWEPRRRSRSGRTLRRGHLARRDL
ncbi:hypothetical protein E8E14_014318 [Neopestalotiopsis sp. 37M]|nr:hypothetical protein E8E14_014318 [Neopestalotiopsis sp. 37M]